MKAVFKPVAVSALICCAALIAPLSAVAAPYHTVCHVEKHNHHPVRVCHRVRGH